MIGRETEARQLEDLYDSGKAELVAVYGRRRIGKTYLINEVFGNRFTFKHTGLSPAEETPAGAMRKQLSQFYLSLQEYGAEKTRTPKNWQEAFFMLRMLLEEKDNGGRQVVFIDELPWLDTKRSGFITGFESFWNGWGSARSNLMVVVCGSATSWMHDNVINNHGGLYGRVTYEINLRQFSLAETEQFFNSKGISFSRYDIAQSYMITGGIPFYLGYFNRSLSLPQNIDRMFFCKDSPLKDEYRRLFSSVFANPGEMMAIVGQLAKRKPGYTRKELLTILKKTDGGNLSSNLRTLEASDFIVRYVPFGGDGRQVHYKLTDPFCIFYLKFMAGKDSDRLGDGYWEEGIDSQEIVSWRGLAFENVCFRHVEQIKKSLQIEGVRTKESAWTTDDAQIDMLIDRADNVVNLCEIKYYSDMFTVNKEYHMSMMHRKNILSDSIPRTKTVRNTLITTFGLKKNEYSGIFSNVITLDDLFS